MFPKMDTLTTPAPADTLPSSIYLELAHTLRKNLPAPATDSPEDAARRDRAAIAHAASLLPARRTSPPSMSRPAPRRWIACASPASIPTIRPSS